jgi:hypothetical protein
MKRRGDWRFPNLGCFDKAQVCVKSMFNNPAYLKWRAVVFVINHGAPLYLLSIV